MGHCRPLVLICRYCLRSANDAHIHLLSDLQRSLAERLRLLVFASLPVQHGEVVEGRRHGRVVFPQRFLPDGEGVIQEVSRFFVLVLIPAEADFPGGEYIVPVK